MNHFVDQAIQNMLFVGLLKCEELIRIFRELMKGQAQKRVLGESCGTQYGMTVFITLPLPSPPLVSVYNPSH